MASALVWGKEVAKIINYLSPAIVAVATVAVAWFTWTLKRSSDKMWRATQQEFVATHRPRIRVRRIHSPDFASLKLLKATILVTNVGDGPCDITFFGIGFARKRDKRWLNGKVPDLRDNILTSNIHLVAGKPRFIDTKGVVSLDDSAFSDIKQARDDLYILGQINYTDDLGTRRHTSFCWQWDVGTQDFRKPEKDDEWNYED